MLGSPHCHAGIRYAVRRETHFSSLGDAALRMVDENERFMAIQGSRTWAGLDGDIAPGDERYKPFILGHQFHALLIHFDELLSDVHVEQHVLFDGEQTRAMAGSSPFGGTVYRIDEDESGRVPGMVFEFPETPRIEVRFSGYEEIDGLRVPRQLVVDDGSATFDYRFWSLNLSESGKTWIDDHRALNAMINEDRPAGRLCADPDS